MTWKELSLKERSKIYKEARAISPDLTYFDIRDIMDNGYGSWFDKLQKQRGEMAQDYDYRKFYSRNRDDAEAMLTGDTSAHFTDQYKLPNHPTFSNESIYNTTTTPGGNWVEHPNDKWEFQHSDFTMRHSDETLNYLKENDNNSISTYKGGVVLPEVTVNAYSNGGITEEPVAATFGLPEVNIYPQNEFGDIARSQGVNTARNWRTVKEGTTKGINDFYNDPRTQMVMAGLPMPSMLDAAGDALKVVGPVLKNSKIGKIVSNFLGPKEQTFYHGSPFNFDQFDPREIGTAEGARKGMLGINLSEDTKIAPKFANIKSDDAPIHLGKPRPTDKVVDPRIYTVTGRLRLKDIPKAKGFNQIDILAEGYDGVRVASPRQVTVFPESVNKLKINKKQTIEEFIRSKPNDEFAEWTTTPEKYGWLKNNTQTK